MAATCRLIAENNYRTLAEVTYPDTSRITTTVTHSTVIVANWINETIEGGGGGGGPRQRRIVGLEVTCKPNGIIALLQLCDGNRCLIYQLLHRGSRDPPHEIYAFFRDIRFCFAAIGVEEITRLLRRQHGFRVTFTLDLGEAASRRLHREDLQQAGLDRLARELLGIEMVRPEELRTSRWSRRTLRRREIAYASVDTYFAFKLGRILSSY